MTTKPKEVKSNAHIDLYSGFSKRLISGRQTKKKWQNIYGFNNFNKKIWTIWYQAKLDNPYAIWYLYKVSKKLKDSEDKIEEFENKFYDLLLEHKKHIKDLKFKSFVKKHYSFNLKTPYSWAYLRLIERFDKICESILQAHTIGLISDSEKYTMFSKASHIFVSSFTEPQEYREFNITRNDIKEQTPAYQKAGNIMGIIPPKILSGELKADFLPNTEPQISK